MRRIGTFGRGARQAPIGACAYDCCPNSVRSGSRRAVRSGSCQAFSRPTRNDTRLANHFRGLTASSEESISPRVTFIALWFQSTSAIEGSGRCPWPLSEN